MKLIVLWLGFSLGFNLTHLDYEHRLCKEIDILEMTISKAQELQLSGKLSAFDLTECYLKRIKALNPILHAVIETNPDALKIAEEKDVLAKSGILSGLLHGVPILIKDNIATGDKMETTAGSLALVGMKPTKDATVISRLRKAGAIILGKANLSELAGLEAIMPYHNINNYTYIQAQQYIKRESKRMLDGLLNDNNVHVIATPSIPLKLNLLCAISGYPVIVVPAGYDEKSVPFGMWFYTKPDYEHLLLSLANEYEKVAEKRRLPTFLP
ncbi:hypothetical protein L0F63_006789 [Massospora cicadina]|nr:hypothetical protein L0F63_006789 [Massospora cicadina]